MKFSYSSKIIDVGISSLTTTSSLKKISVFKSFPVNVIKDKAAAIIKSKLFLS